MSSITVGTQAHDAHPAGLGHAGSFLSTYVFSRDHKVIGIQFLFSTLLWFLVGGLLVLDIQPLSFLAATGEDRRRWTAQNGDLLTIEGKRTATDWLNQRAEGSLRYERWRNNALVETQLEPMAQRYWGLGEFTMALETAGFTGVSVAGGYVRGRSPRARDRVLTFEARRT